MQIYSFPIEIPPSLDTFPDGSCLFDIETTGLSWRQSHLYLIGALKKQGDSWQMTQLFCESPLDEKQVLQAFSEMLGDVSHLFHFNGRTFDLPYLKRKYDFYRLTDVISSIQETDLYARLRPYRSLFPVSAMKQKDLEQLAGQYRLDDKSGKELIDVYRAYLNTADSDLLEMLLLHNREDVFGMTRVAGLLTFEQLPEGAFSVLETEIKDDTITFFLQTEQPFLFSFSHCLDVFSLQGSPEQLYLSVTIFHGTLKYFFSDYKNYYYLPEEDTAIHKSIGRYVERTHRISATPKNCYQKKTGSFIPLPPGYPCGTPVFHEDHRSRQAWFLFEDLSSVDDFKPYVQAVLSYVIKSRCKK